MGFGTGRSMREWRSRSPCATPTRVGSGDAPGDARSRPRPNPGLRVRLPAGAPVSTVPIPSRTCAGLTDEALFVAYRDTRDMASRNVLVARFMPLARKLAQRYAHSSEPLDDLLQVASLGLLYAIERFEPTRGTKFTSFATPTILGELKRYFRDKGWSIRVPRDIQERVLAVSVHTDRLSARLGRAPDVIELAAAVGCTLEEVVEALDASHNYHPASLDAPAAQGDEEHYALGDTLGRDDDGFELADERAEIANRWASLSEVQRCVLRLRLTSELTQRQIADQIGCSQMHVSRLIRRSLTQLDLSPAESDHQSPRAGYDDSTPNAGMTTA